MADERGGAHARDPYKTLQVDPEADPEVIQAAYRRLAQKYHPDVATGPEAEARMAAINAAWAVLRDPVARAAYDRRRAASVAPPSPSPSPAQASTSSGAHAPGRSGGPTAPAFHADARPGPPTPDHVSRDRSSGRSSTGGGYDPASMRAAEGLGAAGAPPGHPSGTVLAFGRYAGWSLGEIARRDLEYIEWLDRMPIGRPYREEIDALLRRAGRRRSASADEGPRRGLFRRR